VWEVSDTDYKRMFERQVEITTKRVDELFEERAKCERLQCALNALKEALRLVPYEKGGSCKWEYDWRNDTWDTGCGDSFIVIDATPSQNGMRYCPYCGKVINEIIEKRAEE